MSTVYLCIGTQKTGTTYLQRFMAENREALKKQGYCYPDLTLGMNRMFENRNAHFLTYLSTIGEEEECRADEAEKKRMAYEILGELAKEYSNIVLSDETIWYQCKKKENFWTELLEEFHKIGCEVKVIVYLRRQDQVISSLWNQRLKGMPGITYTFLEFIEQGRFKWFPLNYYSHLQKIAGYVGKENLTVRVFERGQFGGSQNSLLTDYLDAINVTLTDDFHQPEEEVNFGLSGNFIEMKRIINGIPQYQEMNNFMRIPIVAASVYQAQENPEEKVSMFSYEKLLKFMARYEEGNRKTAVEFLGREDGVLFKEPLKELPAWSVKDENMYRDMLTFMTEMFCAQERKIVELTQKVEDLSKNVTFVGSELAEVKKDTKALNNSLIFRGYRKVKRAVKK